MANADDPFVPVGTSLLFENEITRIWEVKLQPGERHGLHHHEYPYVVIAIEHGDNQITNTAGEIRKVNEPPGNWVVRPSGEVHELVNVGSTTYVSRLIEFKYGESATPDRTIAHLEESMHMTPGSPSLQELLIDAEKIEWRAKSLPGLFEKRLWSDENTGASIALVKFKKGSGIPEPHSHAANFFMYCLSGRYEYENSKLVLTAGSFYWNPKGLVHGPTIAHEDSVFLETYDGPHYPVKPSWYKDEHDAH